MSTHQLIYDGRFFERGALKTILSAVLLTATIAALWPLPTLANTIQAKPIWVINDEEMVEPLGHLSDVGVDAKQTVYLFDMTLHNIRKIDIDGNELPSIGREGQGPGEISDGTSIVVDANGACIVLPMQTRPAACILSNGDACDSWLLDNITKGGVLVPTLRGGRIDQAGRLYLFTRETIWGKLPSRIDMSEESMEATRSAIKGTVSSWLRASPPSNGKPCEVEVLLSRDVDQAKKFGELTKLAEQGPALVEVDFGWGSHGWDVQPSGRLLFAVPRQRRVMVVEPFNAGETPHVSTTPVPKDSAAEARLHEFAALRGASLEDYSPVGFARWLDDRHFFVIQNTSVIVSADSRCYDFDIFRAAEGESVEYLGKTRVDFDFQPQFDRPFFEGGLLVVARNSMAGLIASISEKERRRMTENWYESRRKRGDKTLEADIAAGATPFGQSHPDMDYVELRAYDMRALLLDKP